MNQLALIAIDLFQNYYFIIVTIFKFEISSILASLYQNQKDLQMIITF